MYIGKTYIYIYRKGWLAWRHGASRYPRKKKRGWAWRREERRERSETAEEIASASRQTAAFYCSISRWIRQIIPRPDADDFISRTLREPGIPRLEDWDDTMAPAKIIVDKGDTAREVRPGVSPREFLWSMIFGYANLSDRLRVTKRYTT